MTDKWARDFVACLNSRDTDRLACFFEEQAVLVSPDWTSGQYQEVRLAGRQTIRDDWAARLARMEFIDAVLDSLCEGTDGLALVYRVNAVRIVEVLSVSDRGLIASCKRYGGPTVAAIRSTHMPAAPNWGRRSPPSWSAKNSRHGSTVTSSPAKLGPR